MTDEHLGLSGLLKIAAMEEMPNFGILVKTHLCYHFFSLIMKFSTISLTLRMSHEICNAYW
jgi:hypothetical protein